MMSEVLSAQFSYDIFLRMIAFEVSYPAALCSIRNVRGATYFEHVAFVFAFLLKVVTYFTITMSCAAAMPG